MASWNRIIFLAVITSALLWSCSDRRNIEEGSILQAVSYNGEFAVDSKVTLTPDSVLFYSAVVEVQNYLTLSHDFIDSLPDRVRFSEFCEHPYICYVLSDSTGSHFVLHNYLYPESTFTLYSNTGKDKASKWLKPFREFQFLLRDSLLCYGEGTDLIIRKLLPNGSFVKKQRFSDASLPKLSNDGRELLMIVSENYMTDSMEYHVLSYDIALDESTSLFSFRYIDIGSRPVTHGPELPVYFIWQGTGERVLNVWKYIRNDSSFHQVTNYKYPLSASYIDLISDSLLCLVNDLSKKRGLKFHYEVYAIESEIVP